MTTTSAKTTLESRLVLALTVLGALLRLWSPGRLGLVHFDEGIYALSGAWIGRPGGLDPMVIPYAPAGYPLLVGLAYLVLGASDLAAILVSVAAGTALIPLAGGLGRRLFGPGAGVAAAALAAFSGPQVAFSRMALTDSLALLTWLLALAAGGWFLARPGLVRSMVLGLAVGLAQNVKYSGFLAGVAVGLAAVVPVADLSVAWARERVAVLGWGLLAALIAALTYWPWFAFVERHGGYAGLMAHHRGYVGGWSTWASHFRVQMGEQTALAGSLAGPIAWTGLAWALAWSGSRLIRGKGAENASRSASWATHCVLLLVLGLIPTAAWWVTLARVPFWLRSSSNGLRVLGMAWVVQAVLTPLYHPYARLWLPVEALGWFALAEVASGAALKARRERMTLTVSLGGALLFAVFAMPGAQPWSGLLGPSDGLRNACDQVAETVEPERQAGAFSGARILARPPVLFYFSQRGIGPLMRVEDRANLLRRGASTEWAVEDSGVDGSNPSSTEVDPEGWTIELRCPAPLTIPAQLDLDPGSSLRPEPAWSPEKSPSVLTLYRPNS